jgi:16S rRNA (guanine966-N2)-methyltransferase
MRVTGGRIRGRRLISPKGMNIRPTADRVREAVFSLIGQDLTACEVLDLFAGTGSLGIEALSRGASRALFIDLNHQALELIKKNLTLCGYESFGTALKWDLRKGLPGKERMRVQQFNLVFIDPPYGKALVSPMLSELIKRDLITSPSTVVVESATSDPLPAAWAELKRRHSKRYGETKIDVYHRGAET